MHTCSNASLVWVLIASSVTGCQTIQLKSEAVTVRTITPVVARDCEHRGIANSFQPVIVGGMSAAQVDIRNKIASLGANAMVITAQYTDPPPYPHGNISAEAYKCEFASDRKQPEAAIVGLILTDLTPAQRTELERNSGANVSAVVDDSPAWKANVIPGDVVVEINQEQVKNGLHATKLLNQADVGRRSITIVLIRKGAQRTITVSK